MMNEREVLIENKLIHGLSVRTFVVFLLFTISIIGAVMGTYNSLRSQNAELINKFEKMELQEKSDSLIKTLQMGELKERVELDEAEINALNARLDNYLDKKK